MATAVITVASGGIAVIDVTATTPLRGVPVTEAIAVSGVKYGIAVTKVTSPVLGIPVTYIFADGSLDTGGGGGGGGGTNNTAVRIHHLQW